MAEGKIRDAKICGAKYIIQSKSKDFLVIEELWTEVQRPVRPYQAYQHICYESSRGKENWCRKKKYDQWMTYQKLWKLKGNRITYPTHWKKKSVNQEFYIQQNCPSNMNEKSRHSQVKTKRFIASCCISSYIKCEQTNYRTQKAKIVRLDKKARCTCMLSAKDTP